MFVHIYLCVAVSAHSFVLPYLQTAETSVRKSRAMMNEGVAGVQNGQIVLNDAQTYVDEVAGVIIPHGILHLFGRHEVQNPPLWP